MDWFEKLNMYFPITEMKSKKHMETLLDEKGDVYHKDETSKYVMMYAEFDSFLFIDYIWVSEETRGEGIGHQLIEKLKAKNKPIILEVEPIDYEDSDSKKRLHFYNREGFTHAQYIGYNRRSLATNERNPLEILYWSPDNISEKEIYNQMKTIYEDIHTYKDKEIYGDSYEVVDEALKYDRQRDSENILENLKNNKK